MTELKLDLGVKEIKVDEEYSLFFNPADAAFFARMIEAFTEVGRVHDEEMPKVANTEDSAEILEILRTAEDEAREKINDLFGGPACEHIFRHPEAGSVSVFAASDGLPAWMNLFFFLLDHTDEAFLREQKRTNPRLESILAKYKKRRKK